MLTKVSAALLGVALFAGAANAQETTIKFTLGWKTQGSDAAFFYAKDNGYFKEEGLNVVIDQGEGSGATVTRIMSGAYDAGFGDVNAIIQNASTKPQDAPVMVYMIWNQPPFAIVTKKTSGINTHQGFRRPYARRRAGHADDAAAAGVRAQERAGRREDQDLQHGAEPAGADADQGRHRRARWCSTSPATSTSC